MSQTGEISMKLGLVRYRTRSSRNNEHGAVLVMMAAAMAGIMGLVALAIDVGQVSVTRRKLQNAADAAALAGVARLPGSVSNAAADATEIAMTNGLVFNEVTDIVVSDTEFTNDTIQVTVTRRVDYTFARVLGLVYKDVTATAVAQLKSTQGADTERSGMFPYAVWGGNTTTPQPLAAGTYVVYRSSNYAATNVKSIPSQIGVKECERKLGSGQIVYNCNWDVNSNTFKGYFHWKNRYIWIDATQTQTFNQGGTSFGTQAEPIADLMKYQTSGTPVWLPYVFTATDQTSGLQFTVVDFVCVKLDVISQQGSADWGGWVQDPKSDGCSKGIGLPSGGKNPPTGLPPVYNFRLVQ
jgi:Flp pilus assembly protein TadG